MTGTVDRKRCRHCRNEFVRPASKSMTNARWVQKSYCDRRCAFLAARSRVAQVEVRDR